MWKVVWLCGAVCGIARGLGGAAEPRAARRADADMALVLELSAVNYSSPDINTTYSTSNEFDMRAMGFLYNYTTVVIDVIANKQAYPEGMVSVSDGHLEVEPPREHWRELLAFYAGPVAVLAAAALLAAALPLAGLFWCCCYWCRAGRRRRPFDRKYDACLKGALAILLIGLLTLFLFGVVCAFATESAMEAGSRDAADALAAGLGDARAHLNATQAHARHLLVRNYGELRARLGEALGGGGAAAAAAARAVARAGAVSSLHTLLARLAGVVHDLRDVTNLTARLEVDADRLHTELHKVRWQLIQTLNSCPEPECVRLKEKYQVTKLESTISYNQMLDKFFPTMPNVRELLRNVSALVEGEPGLADEVDAGQRAFDELQAHVAAQLAAAAPHVHRALDRLGEQLERYADEISWACGNASAQLARLQAEEPGAVGALRAAYARYGGARRYASAGVAAALLLLVALLAAGLLCGVCGKRPDAYAAGDCCNKGAGSKWLLCGVGLMFAAGGAAALALAAHFAAGLLGQRLLCDPLTEPRGNRLFEDAERFVDLERAVFGREPPPPPPHDPAYNMSAALLRCHRNHTLYETLQLWRRVPWAEAREAALAELARRAAELGARAAPPAPVRLLTPRAHRLLARLGDTGLADFDFDRILHALESNLTSLPLDALAEQLRNASEALAARVRFGAVPGQLAEAADKLRAVHKHTVLPMLALSDTLAATTIRLRDMLHFNHSTLQYLIYETSQAEQYINTHGADLVKNTTRQFAAAAAQRVEEYLALLEHAARHRVGRCGPLSRAFNNTRDAFCRNILMPTNGYWMSVSWCLVLFVPVMVVAQRLARLYLHVDPYPGPLVDAEYLYDAYADRDNVPLANAYKVEKRTGREARPRGGRGGGGGGGGGGGEGPGGAAGGGPGGAGGGAGAGALAAPVDAHHARRYNDMAPKHWEEGPPRYLGPGPTEYERPPPYYYPGPHDRQ